MEFDRVELPFIIALWIFVSSLAKIGKNQSWIDWPQVKRKFMWFLLSNIAIKLRYPGHGHLRGDNYAELWIIIHLMYVMVSVKTTARTIVLSQMNKFRTARCDFTRKFAIFVPKLLMKVSWKYLVFIKWRLRKHCFNYEQTLTYFSYNMK